MKTKALLIALAIATIPAAASAKTYDIRTDFGTAASPFTFGIGTAGSTFTPFTSGLLSNCFGNAGFNCLTNGGKSEVPVAGLNTAATSADFAGTVSVPSGALFVHPGDSDAADVIVNFLAPISTTYTFSGAFTRYSTTPGGTGVIGSVVGTGISKLILGSAAYGTSAPFGGSIFLNAGQTLSIAVNRNAEYSYDSTGISALISTPEPATWAMMILGMGVVGAALRRRKAVATAAFA